MEEEDPAKEVQRVLDAIDVLAEGEPPAVRARRLTELLKSVGEKVRRERRQALLEMQAAGMTLREISKVSGISFARVRQILADDPESRGHAD